MGRAVCATAAERGDTAIVAGIDKNIPEVPMAFPVFQSPDDVNVEADVLIDFSHHTALEGLLRFVTAKRLPAVFATTGYTPEDEAAVSRAATGLPIFRSANMSYGVHVLNELVRKATETLWDSYDVEIVEAHHHHKQDAPSGTAKMLLKTIVETSGAGTPCYGRNGLPGPRSENEVGVHAVRGGTIVGEHTVLFAGYDEMIEIKHTALSKKVFAVGALKAAAFLPGKPAGLYSMKDLRQTEEQQ